MKALLAASFICCSTIAVAAENDAVVYTSLTVAIWKFCSISKSERSVSIYDKLLREGQQASGLPAEEFQSLIEARAEQSWSLIRDGFSKQEIAQFCADKNRGFNELQ